MIHLLMSGGLWEDVLFGDNSKIFTSEKKVNWEIFH